MADHLKVSEHIEEPAVPGWARNVTTVAVLTGAGVSTGAGIPDFRGPQGVWTKDPAAEKLFNYQAYLSDPAVRRRSWQARCEHPAWRAEPTAAHRALAALARSGIDATILTQNVDGLHERAGTPPERLLELHGNMFHTVCVACGDRLPTSEAKARIEAGDPDPACLRCGGVLKVATVMFGEALNADVLARAGAAATACDLFIAIGTTLVVEPAASLCLLALRSGARLVIVNRDRTPYDESAAAVIREEIQTAVPRLVGQLPGVNG